MFSKAIIQTGTSLQQDSPEWSGQPLHRAAAYDAAHPHCRVDFYGSPLRSSRLLHALERNHMPTLRTLLLSGVFLVLLGWTGLLHGQSTGTIRGTVTDPTGAIIPGALVNTTNTATGLKRTEKTNESGIYVFTDLPIGSYTLEVNATGFAPRRLTDATLLTGQSLGLDVTLDVGSAGEQVTITSARDLIQTSTSEVATSVDQQQMQDLPLNARNPLQLTQLTPGAALTTVGTESGQQDNVGLTVNGLRPTQNNYQLDGALYVNRFFDSVPVLPSPDGLQEFTIQAANFSAEYGGAGALVQLSSRSGTNQLHGAAFEFIRNTVLDARNYFNRAPSATSPFKLNQFGGTVGGPIIIPHLYNGRDRTFFFFSSEDLQRRSSPNSATIFLPTAAELAGTFGSTAIHNPTTGVAYANNQITTPLDPLSAAVANAFIRPNYSSPGYTAATGALIINPNANIDQTQYLIKVDHNVSQANHFSARYFYVEDNFQRAFNAPFGFYANNEFRNQSLTLADTQVISNTLTATLYASAGRFARTQIPVSPGLQNLQTLGANVPLGTTNIPVFTGVRANISGFVDLFSGGALTQDPTTFEFRAQAVKVAGRHTISFGATYERTRIDATDFSYTPGDNTFNGQRSGNAVADFYLGLDSTFFQDNGRKFYLRENRVGLYVQDDFKLNRNLTINAGLRWDPWLPPIDLNNTLVGFIPGKQSTVAPNAPLGLQFNGDSGIQPSIYQKNYKDFAPRVGFAYNVDGKGATVVRGAYGLFYGFPEGLLYQRTDQNQPVNLYLQINNPVGTWDNPYAGYPGGDPFPRGKVSPSQFSNYQFILPFAGGVLNPNSKVEYTQAYNLTVEQQMPAGFVMSLAYVGNHALHIDGSLYLNPALPTPGIVSTVANENSRRLYPGLGAVTEDTPYEYAIYNALQLNVTRRAQHGLTVLGNVTFSKAIDNSSDATELATGPPNPLNTQSSRGPADYDQTVRFNAAVDYIFPTYRGNHFAQAFLNGWEGNLIANIFTGLPFTVLSGTDRSLSGVGNDYADIVPGVNPHITTPGLTRVQQFFNPAAFAMAALGTYGNSSRNSLRGPGFEEVDLSLFRNFFPERRVHGQFRIEGFDVLNHANLANPVSTLSSAAVGSITSTLATSSTNLGPRVFQFGAKILF